MAWPEPGCLRRRGWRVLFFCPSNLGHPYDRTTQIRVGGKNMFLPSAQKTFFPIYILFVHILARARHHLRSVWKTCAVLDEWCTSDCSKLLLGCWVLVRKLENGLHQGALTVKASWIPWPIKHKKINEEISFILFLLFFVLSLWEAPLTLN